MERLKNEFTIILVYCKITIVKRIIRDLFRRFPKLNNHCCIHRAALSLDSMSLSTTYIYLPRMCYYIICSLYVTKYDRKLRRKIYQENKWKMSFQLINKSQLKFLSSCYFFQADQRDRYEYRIDSYELN